MTEYGYDKVGNTVSVTKDGTVIAKSEYDGAYRVEKRLTDWVMREQSNMTA